MLASYIRSLNENEFSRPLKIYGALNINVKNFDRELDRTVKKVENGMSGFLTQPVLTAEAAENLKRAYETLKPLGAKLLGGIIPVVSARNARFMNSEISGINVDPKIIDMYEGKDRDECTELAVRISTEIAEHIKDFTDGYYLMTPFSRTDIMSRIVAYIKENIA
jgi:homocysteine S-methyltransferase